MDEGSNTNVPVMVAMLSDEFGKDDLASTDDRVHITVSSIDDSPDPFLPQPRAPPALIQVPDYPVSPPDPPEVFTPPDSPRINPLASPILEGSSCHSLFIRHTSHKFFY